MASRWQRLKDGDAWIMGVLNCTPDSFSDGGVFLDSAGMNVEAAVNHGLEMWKQGAAIIDVGGESTRPGATAVSLQEELARVIPVVRELSQLGCTVSVDTTKAEVMRQAMHAGATLINDVSALGQDAESLQVAVDTGADVCLMHMQGKPETMQLKPEYHDVIEEVSNFFEQRIEVCLQAGVHLSSIVLDPGIGFGKRLSDNVSLIRSIGYFKGKFNMPILLGVSRKSFLGLLTGCPVEDRELETAVAGAVAVAYGADILRVHDVALQSRAIRTASALTGPAAFSLAS
ncbi:MAG: dihydropteroate synthase [Mariprofundus sp.]|nr:dihydropteroate synthase [Mariprofundus sp.]